MAELVIQREKMESLLGRPFTEAEAKVDYELYLGLAVGELENLLCRKITLPTPQGLQLLIARCFAAKVLEGTSTTASYNVTGKKVEDFSITMDGNLTPMEKFVTTNTWALKKYSQCQGNLRSGRVSRGADCIRCI